MRYLVKARVKKGREKALLEAVENRTLGQGSIAGDEYLHDLEHARINPEGVAQWVEVCYCTTPLDEERPYWEEYFELISVKDAHARENCRHENGKSLWACSDCDCTKRLEAKLRFTDEAFLEMLRKREADNGEE